MGAYILRRILISVPVLFGISIIAFTALALAPGDPLLSRIDPALRAQMDPTALDAARRALGLDQPIPIRYLFWLRDLAQGDLGFSIVSRRSVAEDLTSRLGPTFLLMGTSLLISIIVGIPLGVIAAVRQYSWLDYLLSTLSAAFISIPGFVLSLAGIYIFAVGLRILPASGMTTLGKPFTIGDLAWHLILPAAILSLYTASQLVRYTRASMLEVLSSDFMTTAHAKGLRGRDVLIRHGFRNALIPVITIVGLTLPDVVAGAVITEQIFGWPGMGQLAVKAAGDRDPAPMMGIVLLVAVAVLISNLVADLAYAVADPRIRLEKSRV